MHGNGNATANWPPGSVLLCQTSALVVQEKTQEKAGGKWELVMEKRAADNNGYIYPLNHNASHFPLCRTGSTAFAQGAHG